MATAREVMLFLRPNDSWVMRGEEYEGLEILNGEPLTKEEFLAAFDLVDAAKAQAHEEVKAKKIAAEAKLAALGLTSDDLKALGLN